MNHSLKMFFLSFLASLIFAELVVSIFIKFFPIYDLEMTRYAMELKIPNKNPRIGFSHKPSSVGKFMGVELRMNKQGWRADHDYFIQPSPNIKRVMLLGDSLTLGWGVERRQTFAGLLEQKWNDKRIELLNLGHGNFNAVQVAELYFQQGFQFKPKVVIYYFFLNDIEPIQKQSNYTWLGQSKLLSLFWSRTRILLPKLFGAESDYLSYFHKLYSKPSLGLSEAQSAITQLNDHVKRNGSQFLVIMLPDLHQLKPYPFSAEHTMMKFFFKSHGIEHFDLTQEFSKIKQAKELWVARDDAHPNAKAHEIIAEATEAYLLKQKILENIH